jgi:class 3 adenylate cyclase/DNA-binding transcriptional MerR regulator
MAGPWSFDEFAALTGVPPQDIERYRDAGLLDRRGAGVFQAVDALALQIVVQHISEGRPVDEVLEAIRTSDDRVAKRLFQEDRYTFEDWAAQIGRTPDELRAIATSLGMRQLVFSNEDAAALAVADVLNRAGVPAEGLLEGARVFADSLSRAARTGIQLLHRYLCGPTVLEGIDPEEVQSRSSRFQQEFSEASVGFVSHLYVDYLVRWSIEHAVAHLEQAHLSLPEGSRVATVLFADLSLFSTLSELEGDEAAVALVDRTNTTIRGLAIQFRGHLVKHIGDEFMLVFDDPADAVSFAYELRRHLSENELEAATRIGMHEGPVLYRMGDYYGRAVNAAARIVSLATANSILVTEPIAKAARDKGETAEEIGVRTLRGSEEPLTLYRLLVPRTQ